MKETNLGKRLQEAERDLNSRLRSARQAMVGDYQVGDGTKAVAQAAKTSIVNGVKKRIIDSFQRVYLEKAAIAIAIAVANILSHSRHRRSYLPSLRLLSD